MLKLAAEIVLCLVVFALEQVLGVPLLFFALVLWFSYTQPSLARQIFLCVAGIVIGLVYHLPLAGGWLLMLALAYVWQLRQSSSKNVTARLLVLSLVGSGFLAVLSHLQWRTATVAAMAVSLLLTYLFARATFFLNNTGQSFHFKSSLRLVNIRGKL